MSAKQIELEGVTLTLSVKSVHETRDLNEGDLYVGWAPNTGPALLTCRSVRWTYETKVLGMTWQQAGWVCSKEPSYPRDTTACFKVLAIDGQEA